VESANGISITSSESREWSARIPGPKGETRLRQSANTADLCLVRPEVRQLCDRTGNARPAVQPLVMGTDLPASLLVIIWAVLLVGLMPNSFGQVGGLRASDMEDNLRWPPVR